MEPRQFYQQPQKPQPQQQQQHRPKEMKGQPSLKHLFTFVTWQNCGPLTAGLITALFSGALRTALAILIGKIFEAISEFGSGQLAGPDTLAQVSSWCVVLVLIGGAGWIVNFSFMLSWIVFSELQARNIRQKMFFALLKKDMRWFDCQQDGVASLLIRMQTQTRELQMASSVALGSLAAEIATSLANLVVALNGSWKLTLVLLATVPISVIILAMLSRTLKQAIQAQKLELGRASKFVISAVTAIDLVKAFNGTDHETWQYLQAIRRSMDKYLIQARASAGQFCYVRLWIDGMFVLGFYYGVVLVNEGLSPGNVMTTFYAALAALQAIEAFIPMYMVLARGMSAGQALYFIANEIEGGRRVQRMIGSRQPKHCFGNIKFDHVTFAYPSNPSKIVLNKSSFSFQAGQLYFVVGRSGSGKSTLGNLLLNFYEPLSGDILIDGYALQTLDVEWVRKNITLIQQTSVLFNDTFSINVAMGHPNPTRVSSAEITTACETALLQSTLAGLPNGLDTYVGPGGHDLSGGQKQRLALARAKIRDPPVLILDEITSGLDPVSRSLIMDAIRQWRQDKTTIIITHEVAQIQDYDFIYVMDDARVVQAGHRKDLQLQKGGVFSVLVSSLAADDGEISDQETNTIINFSRPRSTAQPEDRTLSKYFWPFDRRDSQYLTRRNTMAMGGSQHILNKVHWDDDEADSRPLQTGEPITQSKFLRTVGTLGRQLSTSWKHESRLFRGISGQKTVPDRTASILRLQDLGDRVRDDRVGTFRKVGRQALASESAITSISESHNGDDHKKSEKNERISLWGIYRTVWPCLSLTQRIALLIGFVMCILVAGSVPAFSVIFANLLAVLYSGGNKMEAGTKWALYLLLIAFLGAVSTFLSQYLVQWAGQAWVNALRMQALNRILRQPKAWFDKPDHSTVRISECMDRNAEEMRNLIGRFAPQLLVVVIMILTTIIWALIISWKLTLVSLGSAPLLIAATKGYAFVSQKWETRSNKAAQETSTILTETFLNIRVVRALTLEHFFSVKYDKSIGKAFEIGVRKAVWTATLFACWQSIFWFMMALIFWYATVLLTVNREVTVSAILQVVNLLVLGLTTASNILNSVPSISTAQATAAQLLYYATLPVGTSHEPTGGTKLTSPLPIRMEGLYFAYPSSMKNIVLRNLTLAVDAGTSTAIVGPSGCGKSTIASIIVGLYVPDLSGGQRRQQLTFALTPVSEINIIDLRNHIGYVPQVPFLFPATIAGNISYGLPEDSLLRKSDNLERAAKEAGIHDFIHSLAAGYDTIVGDGGQSISGGQAQRICIARALARRPKLLVLDEPTSALDAEGAEAVRHTIEHLMRIARFTMRDREDDLGVLAAGMLQEELSIVVITHSKEMMRVADRIVVIDQGCAVEAGPYNELVAKNGKFTELVNDGLWVDGDRSSYSSRRRRSASTGEGKIKKTGSSDLPLRRTNLSDENDPVTTPRWIGIRDAQWADGRGPSTGVLSPMSSPFGAPSRRKEHKGDDNA
ncbi:P-loop containing nucleoside triphosphate hydrolase protein [Hypoxylon trugodes]|uniref:P-loop containing nucleoside triphosphate hydrolase protein n=1 Tax=Hypoxylon trugodes TaxID=326681 RepID=UPI0021A246CB|nr:P-loop containing nucleoside triphosphate hydrolase protein [Hypoxylon trugodes]KAI1393072.1 P-loop containing nucleoside triphosphate hydrolase protein [Hypoxylon trugodes]